MHVFTSPPVLLGKTYRDVRSKAETSNGNEPWKLQHLSLARNNFGRRTEVRLQQISEFEDDAETAAKLVAAVGQTAQKHQATPSQVAINWCIAKGTVPIPGARNLKQLKDNLGAQAWKMDAEDLALLDAACASVKPLAASPFPEKDIQTGLKMFDS